MIAKHDRKKIENTECETDQTKCIQNVYIYIYRILVLFFSLLTLLTLLTILKTGAVLFIST